MLYKWSATAAKCRRAFNRCAAAGRFVVPLGRLTEGSAGELCASNTGWSGQQSMVTDTGCCSLGGAIAHDCLQACSTNCRHVRKLLDGVKESGCDEDGRQALPLGAAWGRRPQLRNTECLGGPPSSVPGELSPVSCLLRLRVEAPEQRWCEASQANRNDPTRAAPSPRCRLPPVTVTSLATGLGTAPRSARTLLLDASVECAQYLSSPHVPRLSLWRRRPPESQEVLWLHHSRQPTP